MKITNHETRNSSASFLTGVALAVVLGSMVALPTSAFALGGGGGGGGSAPAPKVTKVDDPVAKPRDEVAEVKKPVVDPDDGVPDEEAPVGELRTKEPEEKTLAIEDPDEDKTETKPDERKTEFPEPDDKITKVGDPATGPEDKTVNKPDERGVGFPNPEAPKVVEATIGFSTSISEMVEDGGRLRLEVRSGVLSQPITLDVVVGGTAEQRTDYTISSTSLTIPAGAASAFLTLTGIDDAVYETSETITLVLKGLLPDGMKFGTDTHTVTIVDDDVVEATVGFARRATQMEEGGNVSLQVALSRTFPQPVTARLSMEGDADAFEFSPGTVTFQPGETSKVVNLIALEDSDGVDERVTIYLGGGFPDGVRHGEIHGHIVTIADNDISGTVGFAAGSDTTANEGDTVRLTVASSVAPAAGSPISLNWSVSPASEVDRAAGTVTITGPARTGTFEINIADDNVAETEERITITLSDGSLHDLFTLGSSATHTITIPANDQVAEIVEATVEFATPFSQIAKGATENLQVVLSNPLPQPLTLTLSEGSSEDGEDKIIDFSSDVLVFQPGETSKVVSFTVRDTENRYESAIVSLEGDLPEGVTLGAHNFHFITILDTSNRPTSGVDEKPGGESPQVAVKPDDETGTDTEDKTVDKPDERTVDFPKPGDETAEVNEATVGFATPTSSVTEGDVHSHMVEIRISEAFPQPVVLDVIAAGTATQGMDYTIPSKITMPANATSAFLTLTGINDDADESDETVALTLVGELLPAGVAISTESTHTVTIIDDDVANTEDEAVEDVVATVGFVTSSSEMAEAGGVVNIEVQITPSIPKPILLYYTTVGSAVGLASGSYFSRRDYTGLVSTRIPANTTNVRYLQLVGIDDTIDEGDETVTYTLVGPLPDGVIFGTRTHTVTIIDDDDAVDEDVTVGFALPFFDVWGHYRDIGAIAVEVVLSKPLPQPLEVFFESNASDAHNNSIDVYHHSNPMIFEPGETSKLLLLDLVDDRWNKYLEYLTTTITGVLPEGVKFGIKSNTILVRSSNRGNSDADQNTEDIHVKKYGGGEITIINEEHVGKIEAMHHAYNQDSAISIENLKIVDNDVVARIFDTQNSGAISIKNTDQGSVGGNIIGKNHGSGKISIENRGTVDGGIRAVQFRDGEIEITNHGSLGDGIRAEHNGSSKVSIENWGTAGVIRVGWMENVYLGDISAEIERYQHYRGGDISIINHGTVSSWMGARHLGKDDILIANHGTVDWMSAYHWGSGDISIVNQGTFGELYVKHYGNNGIVAFEGNISASEWGFLSGETIRLGKVDFERGKEIRKDRSLLEIYGNYESTSDTQLSFRAGPKEWDYGLLWIDGNVTGRTPVSLIVEDEISIINTPVLIKVEDGESQADSFYGEETIGAFDYVLERETVGEFILDPDLVRSAVWRYHADILSKVHDDYLEGFEGANSSADRLAAYRKFRDEVDKVKAEERKAVKDALAGKTLGDAYRDLEEVIANLPKKLDGYYGWRFVRGGLSDAAKKVAETPDEIAENIETPPTKNPDKKTELGLWGEQNGSHTAIGLNALATRLMGGDMVVGTSMARNLSASNNVNVESQITALTANWERKGLYVGGQTRYARFTSDVSTDRLSVVRDNEGTGVNASVDLGYRLALPFDGVDFQVAPQAQLVWSRVNFDDFVGPHGELVSLEDGDLVTGYLGLSWDGEWQDAGGFGRIYGGINLRGALDGQTSVNVSGVSIANERRGLSVDGRLGLSYEWDEGYAVYGEVSALRDDAEEIRADLGVSIDF